jgi:hypothetical protein
MKHEHEVLEPINDEFEIRDLSNTEIEEISGGFCFPIPIPFPKWPFPIGPIIW